MNHYRLVQFRFTIITVVPTCSDSEWLGYWSQLIKSEWGLLRGWLRNTDLNNYAEEEGCQMQDCYWVWHWGMSPTASKRPSSESSGPQSGIQTTSTQVYLPVYVCMPFVRLSTRHPNSSSRHSLPWRTACNKVPFPWVWAKHAPNNFIFSDSVSVLKTEPGTTLSWTRFILKILADTILPVLCRY